MSDADPADEPADDAVELGHTRSRLGPLIAIPTAVVILLLVIVLATRETQQGQRSNGALLGQVAPVVAGPTLDGDIFDIDDQRGRWVVVNFFASWCPPCRVEHPELAEFVERHPSGDAVVVGVAMNDVRTNVEAFFDDLGGDWPVLPTDTTRLVIDYAVTAPPTTFIVAPSGVVVEQIIGPVTADLLDERIRAYETAAETG